MDKEKENLYVTKATLNEAIHEIKIEIKDIDNKHDRMYTELKNSNDNLSTTIVNLNENIKEQTKMMREMVQESKIMRAEIIDIQKENISRDHRLESFEEFKDETSEKMGKKSREILVLMGIVATGLFGIIQAAIQVSHYFF